MATPKRDSETETSTRRGAANTGQRPDSDEYSRFEALTKRLLSVPKNAVRKRNKKHTA